MMKIQSKKSCYFWLINFALLLFVGCSTMRLAPYPTDESTTPPPPPPSVCELLRAKVLEVSDKKDNSKVTITYELANLAPVTIEKIYSQCALLFLIKTKQGTQIAHMKSIFSSVLAESSVIENVDILVSTYDVEEVEVEVVKK
ncbi:hypothetical protein ACI760_04035 [Capnocytophaga canimorsus]|uniref:hypothetical protein n=1 Tax=Capnocytophaga canimorsus TaxID=28188 RepID=UPI003859B70D